MPLLNPDELRYTLAARGLVDGEWVNLRGQPYGYGRSTRSARADRRASDGVESAYPFFKLANALLFALPPCPSTSSRDGSCRLVERGCGGCLDRHPLVDLHVAGADGERGVSRREPRAARRHPGARAALSGPPARDARRGRPRLRDAAAIRIAPAGLPRRRPGRVGVDATSAVTEAVVRLWPTLASVAAVAAYASARLSESPPEGSFGGYADLWAKTVAGREVGPLSPRSWEIYLFVIRSWSHRSSSSSSCARRGAAGSTRARSSPRSLQNAAMVLIAAAFASTPYGY